MELKLMEHEIALLAHYIVESDAIECIVRSPEEVTRQLRGGYDKGHVGAYLYLNDALEHGEMVSKEMIRQVQSLIVTEQPEYGERSLRPDWIGRWRNINVSVGGRSCPSPSIVSKKMKHLIGSIHSWQKHGWSMRTPEENVRFIAGTHYAYLDIHPFADGNGRSSRALVYLLYRHAHLIPFIFTSEDRRETYYRCFDNPNDMVEYFLARTTLPAPLQ